MKLKILAILALGVSASERPSWPSAGCHRASAATTTVPDRRTATAGDVTDDVAATGSVAPRAPRTASRSALRRTWRVAAAASGSTTWTTTDVKVKVGDVVKKGQVLATADTTDLKEQLTAANIAIDTAFINYRQAKADLSTANDAAVNSQIRQAKIAYDAMPSRRSRARRQTRDGPDHSDGDPHRPDRRASSPRSTWSRASTPRPVTRSSSTRPTFEVTAESSRATSPRWRSDRPPRSRSRPSAPTSPAPSRPSPRRHGQRVGRCRVVPRDRFPHRRARHRPRRDDRGRDHHHRQRDERPDRPGGLAPRHGGELHGPGPGCRWHADRHSRSRSGS